MCVLICAHVKVHEWFDLPLAREHRETLRTLPVYAADSIFASLRTAGESRPLPSVTDELDEAGQRRAMKRSAWLQAYFRYRTNLVAHSEQLRDHEALSACDWPKTLEMIAKTWGRLLAFVGLRW